MADIVALHKLFSPATPPLCAVRPSATATAVYGFGDASGSGFGTTFLIQGTIHYRHGQWTNDHQEASSNYRELKNLILGFEEASAAGLLNDCEVFLFTDNTTAEAAFHKGTSSSKTLFELVLRLRCLELHQSLFLHVIHVAGTRMQYQGTDDLSRGQLSSGVLGGGDMLTYIPLHLTAVERSPAVKTWVESWLPGSTTALWMTPFQWYCGRGYPGSCVWAPPPGAADAALEQLAASIHKRPLGSHIVLLPRLWTSRWRRLLGKICDVVFTVPLGTLFWPDTHYEPLIVGIYFPLLPFSPWQLRGTPFMDRLARVLSEVPRTHNDWGGGDILRQFFSQAGALASMPESVARGVLFCNR